MKNKVLSAEDFLLQFENQRLRLKAAVSTEIDKDVFYSSAQGAMVTIDVMIEFAKAHVKAALQTAANKAKTTTIWEGRTNSEVCETIVDENSILNSYPETNIQ